MLKWDHNNRQGNDKYEGFAIDLIKDVSAMLDFEYNLYMVHDGKFGTMLESGEWNGIVGEILVGVGNRKDLYCIL